MSLEHLLLSRHPSHALCIGACVRISALNIFEEARMVTEAALARLTRVSLCSHRGHFVRKLFTHILHDYLTDSFIDEL